MQCHNMQGKFTIEKSAFMIPTTILLMQFQNGGKVHRFVVVKALFHIVYLDYGSELTGWTNGSSPEESGRLCLRLYKAVHISTFSVLSTLGLLSYACVYVYKALVTATVYAIIKLLEQKTLLTGYEPLAATPLRYYPSPLHSYSHCNCAIPRYPASPPHLSPAALRNGHYHQHLFHFWCHQWRSLPHPRTRQYKLSPMVLCYAIPSRWRRCLGARQTRFHR